MNAARADMNRQLDLAAVSNAVTVTQNVIKARLKDRGEQSLKQLQAWFRGTSPDWVQLMLGRLCATGEVSCVRNGLSRRRAGYVYIFRKDEPTR